MLAEIIREVRDGMVRLRRAPLYTAAVISSLGLALGGTAAAFAVLDHVLFGQVAWKDPNTLVLLARRSQSSGLVERAWSYPRLQNIGSLVPRTSMSVAGVGANSVLIAAPSDVEAVRVTAEFVSTNYFGVLGVSPALGRPTLDGHGDLPLSVIVGEELWGERWGRDPTVVGRALRVNGVGLTIVGVMPKGFGGITGGAQLWMPLELAPLVRGEPRALSSYYWAYTAVARLGAGLSEAEQQMTLQRLTQLLGLASAPGEQTRLILMPPRDALVQAQLRTGLVFAFGAALCVLLLVIVNVTGLALARMNAAISDIMIRIALGAGYLRIWRQFAIEGVLLAVAGGIAGLALEGVAIDRLWALRPTHGATWVAALANLGAPAPGARMVVMSLIACLGIVAMIATVPILAVRHHVARSHLSILGGASNAMAGKAQASLRRYLASIQVGLAFVLVLGALLLAGSLRQMRREDYGFVAQDLLSARVDLPKALFDAAGRASFYQRLGERLEALPEVEAAGFDNTRPLAATSTSAAIDMLTASTAGEDKTVTQVRYHTVNASYFRALRVPLLSGAPFNMNETRPTIALVNRAASRELWPSGEAIGRAIPGMTSSGLKGDWHAREVAGTVADVQYGLPGEPMLPDVFVPLSSDPPESGYFFVRARREAGLAPELIRRTVAGVDSRAMLYELEWMPRIVQQASSATAFMTLLVAVYAGVACGIALLGVYSVIAYGVTQRTKEFGLRCALGAPQGAIVRAVLREGLWLTILGVGVGLIASAVVQRLVNSQVFGIGRFGLLDLTTALGIFLAVGLLASALPALRAVRVDPVSALRIQ